jgi:hypothetical protein
MWKKKNLKMGLLYEVSPSRLEFMSQTNRPERKYCSPVATAFFCPHSYVV